MATNPYYQRAFSAIAGTLARARAMVNEFQLIQRGFDLIGDTEARPKYQLSCSDLVTELVADPNAAYFRVQKEFTLIEVRASLLVASTLGAVEINMLINGDPLLSTPITIDVNEKTSTTAAVLPELTITSIPDDAEIIIQIVEPGTGAKGLICSLLGQRLVQRSTP
jgi:hypothetical protein